jgi:hypothetical protein
MIGVAHDKTKGELAAEKAIVQTREACIKFLQERVEDEKN